MTGEAMLLTLAVLAALAGYVIGRWRPVHRISDWAHWQRYGKPPTGIRYWVAWTVLSAENFSWLITHPVQGGRLWFREDRTAPAPAYDPTWRDRRHTDTTEEPTA